MNLSWVAPKDEEKRPSKRLENFCAISNSECDVSTSSQIADAFSIGAKLYSGARV